jgi:cell division protease FtsH
MADALMKYETIDKYQIEDLMDRKPVKDPKGWDDTPPPSANDVSSEGGESEKKGDSSIGGTAEQS